MPISEQFRNQDEPTWSWGDPSLVPTDQLAPPAPEAAEAEPAAAQDPEQIGRPWLDVLMGMVMFLVGQLVVGTVAILVYLMLTGTPLEALLTQNAARDLPEILPVTAIPVAISTIIMAVLWSYVGNRTPSTFLRLQFKKQDLLWGLGTVGVSLVVGVVLAMIFQVAPEESAQLNDSVWTPGMPLETALFAAIAIAVLVPIAEELVFRGIIQNALSRWFNDWVALPVAALIFAIPHIPNFIFLNVSANAMWSGIIQVTILGMVIGLVLIKTGRLGGCIWAHIFNNTMVVISLLYATVMAP